VTAFISSTSQEDVNAAVASIFVDAEDVFALPDDLTPFFHTWPPVQDQQGRFSVPPAAGGNQSDVCHQLQKSSLPRPGMPASNQLETTSSDHGLTKVVSKLDTAAAVDLCQPLADNDNQPPTGLDRDSENDHIVRLSMYGMSAVNKN
jgi:hypothetical protein